MQRIYDMLIGNSFETEKPKTIENNDDWLAILTVKEALPHLSDGIVQNKIDVMDL